jgi:hypothetical protein
MHHVDENIKYGTGTRYLVLTAHLLLSYLQTGTEAGKLSRKYL